ncbi:MAG TPA: tetratricopeptide repeat protein [Polyangiales bacterium]|nr:tetratricopeptide repeat protein [Polyangiales bacterium]
MVALLSAGSAWAAVGSTAAAQARFAATDDAETRAAEAEAKQAFQEGRRAFDDGRFGDALSAFHRAYALTGHSALLFDIALAADRLRDDPAALDAFERYLQANPGAADREQIEQRIAALRRAVARRSATSEHGTPYTAPVPTPAQAAASLQVKDPEAAARSTGATPRDDEGDDSDSPNVFERWWFWTAIGVVAAGTVAAVVLTRDPGSERAMTPKSGLIVMTLGARP